METECDLGEMLVTELRQVGSPSATMTLSKRASASSGEPVSLQDAYAALLGHPAVHRVAGQLGSWALVEWGIPRWVAPQPKMSGGLPYGSVVWADVHISDSYPLGKLRPLIIVGSRRRGKGGLEYAALPVWSRERHGSVHVELPRPGRSKKPSWVSTTPVALGRQYCMPGDGDRVTPGEREAIKAQVKPFDWDRLKVVADGETSGRPMLNPKEIKTMLRQATQR